MSIPAKFSMKAVGVSSVDGYPANFHKIADMLKDGGPGGEGLVVVLVRNPDNEHDSNAVEIHVPGLGAEDMVGHVPRDLAARLAPYLDDHGQYFASVSEVLIVPGLEDKPGLSVAFRRVDAVAS